MRRNLHDHHIRFRSRGGSNQQTNRVTVCAQHHLRGIHGGRIRGEGEAPSAIHWQLGLSGTRGPLVETLGETSAASGAALTGKS